MMRVKINYHELLIENPNAEVIASLASINEVVKVLENGTLVVRPAHVTFHTHCGQIMSEATYKKEESTAEHAASAEMYKKWYHEEQEKVLALQKELDGLTSAIAALKGNAAHKEY